MASRNIRSEKLERLLELLKDREHPLIVCHNNPDPDALAGSYAFKHLIENLRGVECVVGYGGIVGRAENRALVEYLGEGIEHLARIDFRRFDLYALVDTQPGTGNNSFPSYLEADIVLDHHPEAEATRKVGFVDVREDYGATATIVAEYLEAAGLEFTPKVATALYYAIRSDTLALAREATAADRHVYVRAFSEADLDALSSIENATLPESYFRSLYSALADTELADGHCVSSFGLVDNPDMVPELADFLLRLREVSWVITMGLYKRQAVVSVRTRVPGAHADRTIKNIIGPDGTAGGHGSMAGGQITLEKVEEENTVLEKLRERAVAAFGLEKVTWRKLLAGDAPAE